MGNEVIDIIITSAKLLREQGHEGRLVAIAGEGVELDGLCGVNTLFGEVLVYQHFDLTAPNTIQVVTEAVYQKLIATL